MSTENAPELTHEEMFAQLSPEEQAVMFLRTAIPLAREIVKKDLTGTAAKRVLEALLEFPLEKETRTFVSSKEEELFNLGTHIQEKKFILFLASLDQKTSEIEEVGAVPEMKN